MKRECLHTGKEKGTWFSHCQHLLASTWFHQLSRRCSWDSPVVLRGALPISPLGREGKEQHCAVQSSVGIHHRSSPSHLVYNSRFPSNGKHP